MLSRAENDDKTTNYRHTPQAGSQVLHDLNNTPEEVPYLPDNEIRRASVQSDVFSNHSKINKGSFLDLNVKFIAIKAKLSRLFSFRRMINIRTEWQHGGLAEPE